MNEGTPPKASLPKLSNALGWNYNNVVVQWNPSKKPRHPRRLSSENVQVDHLPAGAASSLIVKLNPYRFSGGYSLVIGGVNAFFFEV